MLLKLTEKLIQIRLTHYLESNHILPVSQSGFRKFKSCSTSIAYLISQIHKAFLEGSHLFELLIDIKAVFDMVNPNLLQKC